MLLILRWELLKGIIAVSELWLQLVALAVCVDAWEMSKLIQAFWLPPSFKQRVPLSQCSAHVLRHDVTDAAESRLQALVDELVVLLN